MISIINFFIATYLSIVAITLLKTYLEYLKIKKDKNKTHRIEIVIPLPHHILIEFTNFIMKFIEK